jgi:hypothetical protein
VLIGIKHVLTIYFKQTSLRIFYQLRLSGLMLVDCHYSGLTMGWMIGVRSPSGAKDFSSSLCVQTDSGAHPASYPMGTGVSFPGGKARPGGNADHAPPSSVEVKNEKLLSPHAPPWRVAGQLYFTLLVGIICMLDPCNMIRLPP